MMCHSAIEDFYQFEKKKNPVCGKLLTKLKGNNNSVFEIQINNKTTNNAKANKY